MKRYEQHTSVEYGTGYYDGEKYEYHEMHQSETGEWVKAEDALKLQHRIKRMQKRIDKLEGRTKCAS